MSAKVFISWSGKESRAYATALNEWIPNVMQHVGTYFSPDDIAKGTRWDSEIAIQLDQSHVGILCITKDNTAAPWILFEAGALSKRLSKARVCPVLFGLTPTDLDGPLASFNATVFEKDDILKMLQTINSATDETPLDDARLLNQFNRLWPELDEAVKSIVRSIPPETHTDHRTSDDMIRETLAWVRQIALDQERARVKNHNREVIQDAMRQSTRVETDTDRANDTAVGRLIGINDLFRMRPAHDHQDPSPDAPPP